MKSFCAEQLERRVQLSAHILGNATVYSTIQAAVDAAAPNSVITVDAGSYPEGVVVGKSLTIRGAQAGVDARTNARQAGTGESIVTGVAGSGGQTSAFHVTANDVTIDGFTIQGNTSTSTYGAGVVIAPGTSGTHVLDNIIQNNVSGLFLANASATDPAIIQHNVFANNNNAGANGGRGIFSDGTTSGGTLQNVTIESNFFFHNRGGTGTTGAEAAIALQASAPSTQTNIRITNNTFDGNGKALLAYNASNLTIQGNTITDSSDVDGGALRFEGGVSSVVIQNNNIYNNLAPAMRLDSKVVAAASSGFAINFNNLYGNGYVDLANPPAGIQPGSVLIAAGTYSGSLNAQNNWWGAASGPGGDGPGSGDVLRANGVSVSYSPFNAAPALGQLTPFTGLAQVADSAIQAVTFDQGGSNVAYLVAGSVNASMPYRATAVTTETTTDAGSAYDVAYDVANLKAGQWLSYRVLIPRSGTYRLDSRLASQSGGGTFHATIDGATVGGSQSVSKTNGAQTWQTKSSSNFSAVAGTHTLQLLFDANGSGGSVASFHWVKLVSVTPATVVPSAPANLVAIPVNTSQIDLTWSNTAVNQTGFTLERSSDGTNFSTLTTVSATTTAYADLALAPGKTYYYRVKATNSTGASLPSNIVTGVTPVPPTVTQLGNVNWVSATTGFGTIHIDQTVNGNPLTLRGTVYPHGIGTHAISQIVYNLGGAYSLFSSDVGVDDEVAGSGSIIFQVLGDNNAVLFASGTLTKASAVVHVSVSVAGVQQLTLMVGDAGDGNSYDHADWAGAVLVAGAPAVPTNLVATAAPLEVILNWSASSGASSYNVYRGTSPGTEGATPIATNLSTPTYTDNAVSAGITYYYTVAAVNPGGTSGKSNEASATPTPAQPPATPSNISAYQGIRQVSLSWPSVPGASSYRVYRGTTSGGEASTSYASNLATPSFVDTSVNNGATYYYKVTSVSTYGESAQSIEVRGTALQPPSHVLIVVEENKDFTEILGSPQAPYINSLATQGANFTNFHAITHPSQPNYIALFSGSTQGVTDDTVPTRQFTAPNLGSQLLGAGLTFTGYSEDLPAVGSLVDTGGPIDSVGDPEYARKHNPWSDFSNVPSISNQPYTAFPSNYDQLPTLSFVIPNLDHDMHDGTIAMGDTWLQANMAAYVNWAKTHNSLFILTFDENESGEPSNRIPTIVAGQNVLVGNFNENTGLYGLLRTLEDMYGLTSLGAAATSPTMQDIWTATPQAPSAPTGILATPTASQVTLDWPPVSGANSYSVYRATTPGGESAIPLASGLSTPHFVDTSVSPGTSYYYQITATNSVGEGARSTETTISTLKATPIFSGLTASTSVIYGTSTVSLGGTLTAGSLIPSGTVSISINGTAIGTSINLASGTFTANFDTHLLPASPTTYTITYSFAGNSSFNPAGDASRALTINPRALTVTATATSRVYDGTVTATVTLSDNHINGDILTLSYGSALFADKNVGDVKTINVMGISLSGTSASNYALTSTSAIATADITPRPLTVTAVAVNKVYDGTTSAGVILSDDRIAGDVFTDASTSAAFVTKTVGTAKAINIAGIGIQGPDASNYSLTSTTAAASADITPLPISGSVTTTSKIYDATTSATVLTRTLTGVLGSDAVDLSGGTATFATKTVGTGKTVAVTDLTLTGADAGNYSLDNPIETSTADVTPALVTPDVSASGKIYDASTAATINSRSLDGVLGNDVVTLVGGNATFDTRNVGVSKQVNVSDLSLDGADAVNYLLSTSSISTTADISPLSLAADISVSDKTYDGTTATTVTTTKLNGVLSGDVVNLSGGVASFDTKNAGTGKTVTVTNLSLVGDDCGNYVLSNPVQTVTASITPLIVGGSITVSEKPYDGTTTATITERHLTGVLSEDVVDLTGGAAAFDSKNIGDGKTVTVTGLALAGTDAGNYSLGIVETNTASITPVSTINATAGTDIRLSLDTDASLLDWFIFAGGAATHVGQLRVSDIAGLTITGNAGGNTITLDYANGNPLPNVLRLNGVFTINGLPSSPDALAGTTLEIGASTLYFAYNPGQTPAAAIRAALVRGLSAGTWTGTPAGSTGAITSAQAASGPPGLCGLGYADSADGVVAGQPASTIEVRYTVVGDANLDGIVNSVDSIQMARNYLLPGKGNWDLGDFNYDGKVDFNDALILQKNFNLSIPSTTVTQPSGTQVTPVQQPVAATPVNSPVTTVPPSSNLMNQSIDDPTTPTDDDTSRSSTHKSKGKTHGATRDLTPREKLSTQKQTKGRSGR